MVGVCVREARGRARTDGGEKKVVAAKKPDRTGPHSPFFNFGPACFSPSPSPPLAMRLPPLYGDGYAAAVAQVALVYYGFSAAIHWALPALLAPPSIQVAPRRRGQVLGEAVHSLGKEGGGRGGGKGGGGHGSIAPLRHSFCIRGGSCAPRPGPHPPEGARPPRR